MKLGRSTTFGAPNYSLCHVSLSFVFLPHRSPDPPTTEMPPTTIKFVVISCIRERGREKGVRPFFHFSFIFHNFITQRSETLSISFSVLMNLSNLVMGWVVKMTDI